MSSIRRFSGLGFAGRTADGIGVLVVAGLPAKNDELYEDVIDAVRAMADAPGFIVDLRSNSGGAEPRAAQVAALFADERRMYARSQVRSGPSPEDLRESPARYVGPTVDDPYTRPVICLIGPGCISSGEGFALMMKSLDHVTLVGQATRGASGNPQPVTLSNGVEVWFSRWISLEPDGTPIEGRGVEPAVEVEHEGPGDPTFERAVELLHEQIESARTSPP
ncbi:MAG: S41 family peptidase [Pirellulales bacterium]